MRSRHSMLAFVAPVCVALAACRGESPALPAAPGAPVRSAEAPRAGGTRPSAARVVGVVRRVTLRTVITGGPNVGYVAHDTTPAADAPLEIWQVEGGVSRRIASTRTGARGEFAARLEESRYRIVAPAGPGIAAAEAVVHARAGVTHEVELLIGPERPARE